MGEERFTNLLVSKVLVIAILSLIPAASALAGSYCRPETFDRLDRILDRDMGRATSIMQIGGDADDVLKEVEQLARGNDCLKPQNVQNQLIAGMLQTYDKLQRYVENAATHEYDISEANCGNWISPVARFEKHVQIGNRCASYVFSDLLSHQNGFEVAPFEFAVLFENNAELGEFQHRSKVEKDELDSRTNLASLLYASKFTNRGHCLMSNFDLGRNRTERNLRAYQFSQVLDVLTSNPNREGAKAALMENKHLFHNLTEFEIDSVVAPSRKLDRLQTLFELSCRSRSANNIGLLSTSRSVERSHYSDPNLMELVDQQINFDSAVAIGFWNQRSGGSFLMTGVKTKDRNEDPQIHIDHFASVVGRRFHNRRCEYLIKDPNFNDCRSVAPSFECDRATGNVWVPRSTLVRAVLGITYLQH